MYNHLFHYKNKRILINITLTEAIIEGDDESYIITSNDRYVVNESFDECNKAWMEAMEFEAGTKVEDITYNWNITPAYLIDDGK